VTHKPTKVIIWAIRRAKMEPTITSSHIPELDWSVAAARKKRENVRVQWDRDFDSNYSGLASEIAASLAQKIFQEMKKNVENPYSKLPTQGLPRHFTYVIRVDGKHGENLRTWAPKTSQTAPFDEWIKMFEIKKEKLEEQDSKAEVESEVYLAKRTSYYVDRSSMDAEYFQSKMSKVGHLVVQNLNDNLKAFQSNEGNEDCQFNAIWQCRAEKKSSSFDPLSSLSSMCGAPDNAVYVDIWLAVQQHSAQSAVRSGKAKQQNTPTTCVTS
jgi:hypothetical protein